MVLGPNYSIMTMGRVYEDIPHCLHLAFYHYLGLTSFVCNLSFSFSFFTFSPFLVSDFLVFRFLAFRYQSLSLFRLDFVIASLSSFNFTSLLPFYLYIPLFTWYLFIEHQTSTPRSLPSQILSL